MKLLSSEISFSIATILKCNPKDLVYNFFKLTSFHQPKQCPSSVCAACLLTNSCQPHWPCLPASIGAATHRPVSWPAFCSCRATKIETNFQKINLMTKVKMSTSAKNCKCSRHVIQVMKTLCCGQKPIRCLQDVTSFSLHTVILPPSSGSDPAM